MLVYGECECFVMQMLYVCVLCASCGSSQCCVLHDLQFVNAGRGCNRRPYRRGTQCPVSITYTEAEMLKVREHSDLLYAQYLARYMEPGNVCHPITTRATPERQMKETLDIEKHCRANDG